jgi:hypothetical protein
MTACKKLALKKAQAQINANKTGKIIVPIIIIATLVLFAVTIYFSYQSLGLNYLL